MNKLKEIAAIIAMIFILVMVIAPMFILAVAAWIKMMLWLLEFFFK